MKTCDKFWSTSRTVTAYEAAQRAQEKGDLIGPPFSPQEDMMARCVARELAILDRQAAEGIVPLPPRLLALEEAEEDFSLRARHDSLRAGHSL